MADLLYSLAKPVLFRLDAERAHDLVFSSVGAGGAMARGLARARFGAPDPRLAVDVAGVRFAGPVGLAAGLDKNGRLPRFWPCVGFGAVELGTVTQHPQPGNPQPRLFRIPEARALVNRMGFNNDGSQALATRLRALRAGAPMPVPLGVNLGKSKITPLDKALDDYAESTRRVASLADYLVVNVSSPNTPGLRKLQDASFLRDIVHAVLAEAAGVPVWVKLAPDLGDEALEEAVTVAAEAGASALVATNTTVGRPGVAPARAEPLGAGGLSGAPLRARSLEVVRRVAATGALPVVAVGGLSAAAHVLDALAAGAVATQLYSALIFEGPGLPWRIHRDLARRMASVGVETLEELAQAHASGEAGEAAA